MSDRTRLRQLRKKTTPAATTALDALGTVVLGYVHPENVKASFHDSIVAMLVEDMAGPHVIVGGGGKVSQYSSANISNARNNIVRLFLDQHESEWLLMLDSDMVFEPDLALRLVEAAANGVIGADGERHPVPIVGALAFGVADGRLFPTLYAIEKTDDHQPRMRRFDDYPDNEMFQVNATGAACMLIHRTVLAEMRERFPEPYPWYTESVLGEPPWGNGERGTGSPMGEDITFCLRAGVCGYPVYVHTGITVGHDKHWILTADEYREQRTAELAARAKAAG